MWDDIGSLLSRVLLLIHRQCGNLDSIAS
jgi:hypothetical protein